MRYSPSGSFELALAAPVAMGLFTPEGERDWVPGWDPAYPAGEPSESPGTVFTTQSGGAITTWLIIRLDRDGGSAAYARLTPGLHAGSVHVQVTRLTDDSCRVEVRYDMTRVADAPGDALEPYRPERFHLLLQEWEDLISARP
jgi:hypothetical protein